MAKIKKEVTESSQCACDNCGTDESCGCNNCNCAQGSGCHCGCRAKNPFLLIPVKIAGIYAIIVALFLLFAKSDAGLLVPIAWAFVVLGIIALFFAYRAERV